MKKMLICTVVLFFVAFMVKADDLKTKDGTIYKDVTYFTITPNGIDISYKKGDHTFLTHVFFKNLPEAIQKKFHYSPEKAKRYSAFLKKVHEEAVKKHAMWAKQHKAKTAKDLALESQIEAGEINVVLQVYQSKPDGVVAYASSMHASLTTGHLGKIFVDGMLEMSGGEVAAVLYPTGKTRYGYPCYASTLEQAVQMSNE